MSAEVARSGRCQRGSLPALALAWVVGLAGCEASGAGAAADADVGFASDGTIAVGGGADAADAADAAAGGWLDSVSRNDAVRADGVGDAVGDDAGDVASGGADSDAAWRSDVDATAADGSGGGLPLAVKLGSADPSGMWFVPLAEGATVTLIYGPQGGYHVWASVCVPGWTVGNLSIEAGLYVASTGAEVAPGPVKIKTFAKDYMSVPGWRCRLALPIFVTCACDASGTTMELRAQVTLDGGASGERTRTVVPKHVFGPCLPPGVKGCGL